MYLSRYIPILRDVTEQRFNLPETRLPLLIVHTMDDCDDDDVCVTDVFARLSRIRALLDVNIVDSRM